MQNHIEHANSLYFKDNSTPLACNMLRSCENTKVELFEALLFSSLCCRSASTTPSGSPCSSQQSVYQSREASGPSAGPPSSWNPFGDDNFAKLTAEELLNKDFAKLDGKTNVYIWNQVFQVIFSTVFILVAQTTLYRETTDILCMCVYLCS